MIARRISMNSSNKSNIRKLVNYLTDTQGIAERVQEVRITGCESESAEWAALEMQAVQKMNHRAKGDRTYHLVLSFREEPSIDVLRQVEDRVCDKLGYGEHQRVSVVHGDTDNLHLHIAINKIHPQKLTLHEPFYDHKMLASLCSQLEKTFQLEKDNHVSKGKSRKTGAVDMERVGDLESLTGWIQRNCVEQMEKADSWKALHDILSAHGLTLRPRGNGFVFSSGRFHVKASSVSRTLSKGNLEKRLGTFQPARSSQKVQRSYFRKPLTKAPMTEALWEKYQEWVLNNTGKRQEVLAAIRARRDAELEAAQKSFDTHSMIIKHMTEGALLKRILYSQNRARLERKAKEIREKYLKDRQEIRQEYPHFSWSAWIEGKARSGDSAALQVMRARARKSDMPVRGNYLSGTSRELRPAGGVSKKVTRKGSCLHESGLRETEKEIHVPMNAKDTLVEEALLLAARKFEGSVDVHGSAEFWGKIARVAGERRLSVSFTNPGLEKRRLEVLQQHRRQSRARGR